MGFYCNGWAALQDCVHKKIHELMRNYKALYCEFEMHLLI